MEVPMAKLLSGKEVTASLNEEIRKKVETLNAHQITPKLGIIRIGEIFQKKSRIMRIV